MEFGENRHGLGVFNWANRLLKINEGELSYYKSDDTVNALNIISLGNGKARVETKGTDAFVVYTDKKSYSFRLPLMRESGDEDTKKERDDWVSAIHKASGKAEPRVVYTHSTKHVHRQQPQPATLHTALAPGLVLAHARAFAPASAVLYVFAYGVEITMRACVRVCNALWRALELPLFWRMHVPAALHRAPPPSAALITRADLAYLGGLPICCVRHFNGCQ